MANWNEIYKHILRRQDQSVYPNLDWSNPVGIGDYGEYDYGKDVFTRHGNIGQDFGIQLALADQVTGIDLSGVQGKVTFAKAAASGAGVGDTGAGDVTATWTFSESESMTLVAGNVVNVGLASVPQVGAALQPKIDKSWNKDTVVIYSIWQLNAGFVIGAEQKNSTFSIQGSGSSIDEALAGEASGKFEVLTTSWNGFQKTYPSAEMQSGATPHSPATIQFRAFRLDGSKIVYI